MKKADVIIYFILAFIVVLLLFLINFMKQETTTCVRNPFIYGADKMGDVECQCTQYRDDATARFFFNGSYFGAVKNGNGNIFKLEDIS